MHSRAGSIVISVFPEPAVSAVLSSGTFEAWCNKTHNTWGKFQTMNALMHLLLKHWWPTTFTEWPVGLTICVFFLMRTDWISHIKKNLTSIFKKKVVHKFQYATYWDRMCQIYFVFRHVKKTRCLFSLCKKHSWSMWLIKMFLIIAASDFAFKKTEPTQFILLTLLWYLDSFRGWMGIHLVQCSLIHWCH